MASRPLTLTVAVPTRNRPDHALACVQALLAIEGFESLIVVDQSDDAATRDAVAGLGDARLSYLRTPTRGVTHARNIAIERCATAVVAFTDDDCRVTADWAKRLLTVFEDPEVGVVCGRVQVPPELQQHGWAESFHPRQRQWHRRYPPMGQWGITANMGLRMDAVRQVGPFDVMLGAGAPLRSGGEPDLLFRMLRGGWKVINADEVVVDHLGIRKPGAQSASLLSGYGVGTAAAFMKHVRLGRVAAARILAGFIATTTLRVAVAVARRKRPSGAGFLVSLLRGIGESWRYPIDRERGDYRPRVLPPDAHS